MDVCIDFDYNYWITRHYIIPLNNHIIMLFDGLYRPCLVHHPVAAYIPAVHANFWLCNTRNNDKDVTRMPNNKGRMGMTNHSIRHRWYYRKIRDVMGTLQLPVPYIKDPDDVMMWKRIPHYWLLVRGINRIQGAGNAVLWCCCFFRCCPEETLQQTFK